MTKPRWIRSQPNCTQVCCWLLAMSLALPVMAEEPEPNDEDVLAGHSHHGEAFNEGPRQAAYLMPGMGNVDFPVTTSDQQVQAFFNQGVAQLHGFWYYEAERSFRQAAVIDPDCSMLYWGMAMANYENRQRAQGFIQEAVQRKDSATRREQLYIDALATYLRDRDEDGERIERKQRAQDYIHALETIVEEFPDDIEAKALLAVTLWQRSRDGLPIVSHVAIDALLHDVFEENPQHPAHHYRIHLWDRHKPERALQAAAQCGPSLPGVAHMWHMPGHIYSRLHRYQDACWQQEASARVDHAHMMRDRVMPDQIHNFAHNNEWLIRNLLKVGRVGDSLSLAKNMLELPRHPKYNTPQRRGSSRYGRERLELTLTTYRLWPRVLELADTVYLEPTEEPERQSARWELIGRAHASTGDRAGAKAAIGELQERLADARDSLAQLVADPASAQPNDEPENADEQGRAAEEASSGPEPAGDEQAGDEQDGKEDKEVDEPDDEEADKQQRREKQRERRREKLEATVEQLEQRVASIEACMLAHDEEFDSALERWEKSNLDDPLLKAEWMAAAGQLDEALKLVDKQIEAKPGEVLPLAVKAWLNYEYRELEAAREAFAKAQALAASADLDTPLLERLQPLAEAVGADEHWALDHVAADDIGARPELDTLGPFRWSPYVAPDFAVKSPEGNVLTNKHLRGEPTLVIFYLGFGCLHCVEQLHAFSPHAEQFREAGIEPVAISTEDLESLKTGLSSYDEPLDIPLHADPDLTAFKAFRCFDDFEQQPLHGTFLLDPDGRVLWQDISYEPFMEVDFALEESLRLLRIAGFGEAVRQPRCNEDAERDPRGKETAKRR